MLLEPLDLAVFIGYCLLIIGMGLFVSQEKKGHVKNSSDYFLASKALPWWAVGASLIASNISAEQFIGMSGSGFALGLAISTYEWMAAATLLVVAIFFLPVYIKKGIYTMPGFLLDRYDTRVRTTMAIFWLLLYVFVNLTSVLYLGALSLNTILNVPLVYGIIGLALFAMIYSIYGGLKAVAWTDVVQVVFLIVGGLATTYIALQMVGGGDAWEGIGLLRKEVPGHFSMILSKGEMMIPDGQGGTRDAYLDLPGISVLVGGMWITNLSYWGFNQYITQRALAAKSLDEAQKGMIFAGFLKLLMPLIVVIPGIAALVIVNNGLDATFIESMKDPGTGLIKSDRAYPTLLQLLPVGLKGLAFAALTAAIVSSLASMANSTSTIFTMDIYKKYFGQNASESKQVSVGRITAGVAFFIAALVAPALGQLDQAFQFIQEYTGFISPGVFAIFFFGVFWKKTTSNAALVGAGLSIPLSIVLKVVFPALPFIDRMGVVFLILAALMIIISLVEGKGKDHPNSIEINKALFKTSPGFKIGAFIISGIIAALYIVFW
ncbi:solute:Na+ symporter, SSS family [Algoriphagus ornithinivorans]|jgi:SSS family solute:Na+ symporter|uniref:Solute:Na+ symporter, SSS family n=2 Tax=Algoriphagus TaxID=246875 RepID=A0A1I5H058_9BACT|nr:MULTISPECIES: sodium/sugar symporter [Algoriphagus]MAL13575.1 sodium/glucose cotransporter [Algoriphagus sp.]MAN86247.1 sodium/glucose cotransporter [Algoriphagus sp.]QYH38319.1 sodium/solute symporter [Algoriphagus sp. NBT04N3]SFO41688.1 solute:Na+ symporter, SSS family [Algoriphagus ornithinivorans]HAD51706.1 sodium/glucose cotransporter [Algoriphagus sp.]|tara:strand:+ start:1438 stop:3081 length:1644 start_codon:yes stop_codon:yes gene_type:complete